jgi:hypothetical protein
MLSGIVIGTYDSLGPNGVRHGVPSVELNLAVIRRRCGSVPVLVVDDASPPASQWALRAICARYDATFLSNPERLGHTSGDIAAFGCGLRWAAELGLTVLTKLSQRMIFDVPDWVTEDAELLLASGFGTMTAALSNYGDPSRVRTEAVMMVVPRWSRPEILSRYQPRRYAIWNEGHTAETIRLHIDPQRPFPTLSPLASLAGHSRSRCAPRLFSPDAECRPIFPSVSGRLRSPLADRIADGRQCRDARLPPVRPVHGCSSQRSLSTRHMHLRQIQRGDSRVIMFRNSSASGVTPVPGCGRRRRCGSDGRRGRGSFVCSRCRGAGRSSSGSFAA